MPSSSPEPPRETSSADQLLVQGEGRGTVLLLHAAGSGPRALGRLARSLAGTAGRCLAPAFERDGGSLIGSGPAAFAEAVALVETVLAAEGDGPHVLIGHSMGGLVALLALAAGTRVDAAVLYEPIVLSLLDPGDAADRSALEWDRACIAEFRARLAAGDDEAGVARFVEAYGDVAWPGLPGVVRSALVARAQSLLGEAMATNAARIPVATLARVEVPVLLLRGERSPAVARRMAMRLAAALPHCETAVVPGAGHMAPVAMPEVVAPLVRSFMHRRGLGQGLARDY